MILCVGTTPAVQRVMIFDRLEVDAVNRARRTIDGFAGKSVNVAKVLETLGEQPVATGFVGGPRGQDLRTALERRGIRTEFVTVAPETRLCITVIDGSSRTHTELVEESQPVQLEAFDRLLDILRRGIGACQAVVMSGTITPGGPPDFYLRCARLAREAGVLAVVDAQGPALTTALEAKPGLVKPNRSELALTVGRELRNKHEVISAMRDLVDRGAARVITTAGGKPALAMDGARGWRITPPRIAAVNPIGCGDALTAGVVWRLVRGDDLGEACRWGSAVAAANALTPMPGEVLREDVDRLVRLVGIERI